MAPPRKVLNVQWPIAVSVACCLLVTSGTSFVASGSHRTIYISVCMRPCPNEQASVLVLVRYLGEPRGQCSPDLFLTLECSRLETVFCVKWGGGAFFSVKFFSVFLLLVQCRQSRAEARGGKSVLSEVRVAPSNWGQWAYTRPHLHVCSVPSAFTSPRTPNLVSPTTSTECLGGLLLRGWCAVVTQWRFWELRVHVPYEVL